MPDITTNFGFVFSADDQTTHVVERAQAAADAASGDLEDTLFTFAQSAESITGEVSDLFGELEESAVDLSDSGLVRIDDLVKAEEFAERMGSTQTQPGSKLHTFLLARHIEGLNGQRMTPTRAYQWVKRQPSPILSAFREQVNARTCGYDTAPRFRCKKCGSSFKVRLPLDGRLFRRPTRKR